MAHMAGAGALSSSSAGRFRLDASGLDALPLTELLQKLSEAFMPGCHIPDPEPRFLSVVAGAQGWPLAGGKCEPLSRLRSACISSGTCHTDRRVGPFFPPCAAHSPQQHAGERHEHDILDNIEPDQREI